MDEPMSELRLREIRNEFAAFERKPADQWTERDSQNVVAYAFFSMPLLLAEVERLRAENAAMREIVRQMAERGSVAVDGYHVCWFCDFSDEHPHDVVWTVARARALVAQWDTPEGEGKR